MQTDMHLEGTRYTTPMSERFGRALRLHCFFWLGVGEGGGEGGEMTSGLCRSLPVLVFLVVVMLCS